MNKTPRKEYAKYFITKTRSTSQERFVCLEDGAPEDLAELIRWIHKSYFWGALLNDWIYRVIEQAFIDLNNDDLEDINIEHDIYNNELAEWLKEPFANEYCIQATEELGAQNNIFGAIGQGQYVAKRAIYDAVNAFIQAEIEQE